MADRNETRKQRRPGLTARDVTVLGLAAALMFASQIALSGIANVELVSLFTLLFSIYFGRKALLSIYTFALLEGIWYGFHLWWVMYLYVWTILWLVVRLCSRKGREHGPIFWAFVSGGFGLSFGFFCSFPYVAMGGIKMAYSWWLAGIPFDVTHGIANFVLALVLFYPLDRVMKALKLNLN